MCNRKSLFISEFFIWVVSIVKNMFDDVDWDKSFVVNFGRHIGNVREPKADLMGHSIGLNVQKTNFSHRFQKIVQKNLPVGLFVAPGMDHAYCCRFLAGLLLGLGCDPWTLGKSGPGQNPSWSWSDMTLIAAAIANPPKIWLHKIAIQRFLTTLFTKF